MTKNRAERLEARQEHFGFEKNPPLCHSCIYIRSVRFKEGNELKRYFECQLGKFRVKAYSVCDNWKSHQGETLE